MDLPKPPEDQELHNIIDKLAQFVARNGPEFEQMTKDKQQDNPRFYFLFGGEYFNYYQFRVTSEQAVIKKNHDLQRQQQQQQQHQQQHQQHQHQQQQQQQHLSIVPPFLSQQMLSSGPPQTPPTIWQNNGINNINNSLAPNVLSQQINELQEQIRQSEANLAAQHQVLMQQKQCLIDDTIKQAQEEQLRRLAEDFNLNINEFESVLQPITESCTKESIANGKMWIFNHCSAPIHYEIISKYLLKRITIIGASFDAKLHLMYLINDLFNHCMRKGDDSLKRSLDKVIVAIFCCTFTEADDEKQQKLTKLLKLWEMNQYFERAILDQLQNPALALANYKSALCNEFSGPISSITNGQLAKYSQLQKQHSDFVAHQQSKIQQLQQQQQQLVANVPQMPVSSLPMPVNPSNLTHPSVPRLLLPNQPPNLGSRPPLQFDQPPPPPTSVAMFLPLVHSAPPPPPSASNASQTTQPLILSQLHQTSQMPVRLGPVPQLPQPLVPGSQPFSGPLGTTHFPSPLPNHQFFNAVHNSAPIPPKEVIPDVPYHELPAGLMAPLVKLEDFEYKPIVPKDIRLPPPAPPNDRLLQAVELFYAPPTHERPRNSDGWEQLGLYEFFKAKSQAKKDKEEFPSNSNEMENFEMFSIDSVNTENTNVINNVMPVPIVHSTNSENNTKHNQNSDQSLPGSHPRHRSPSPSKRRYREYREDKSPRKNKSRKSRSRSPSSSRRRHSRSHSKSRSRSRSPIRAYRSRSRSLSPPHTYTSYGKVDASRLDESNKGHQMLKKMGWSGASGLGASEQGIQDPIKGGDVRDRDEMYRGVGIKNSENDPFEKFRKNKGQAFMQRIAQGRSDK